MLSLISSGGDGVGDGCGDGGGDGDDGGDGGGGVWGRYIKGPFSGFLRQ